MEIFLFVMIFLWIGGLPNAELADCHVITTTNNDDVERQRISTDNRVQFNDNNVIPNKFVAEMEPFLEQQDTRPYKYIPGFSQRRQGDSSSKTPPPEVDETKSLDRQTGSGWKQDTVSQDNHKVTEIFTDTLHVLISDLSAQKSRLDALDARQSWFEHDLQSLNASQRALWEAITGLDSAAGMLAGAQSEQERRLAELEDNLHKYAQLLRNSPPSVESYPHIHRTAMQSTPPVYAPPRKERAHNKHTNDVKLNDQNRDAIYGSLTETRNECSEQCYAKEDAEKFETEIGNKLTSSMHMLRYLGDIVNQLNASSAEIMELSTVRERYVNNLSVDIENLKDFMQRNRKLIRNQSNKLEQVENEYGRVMHDIKDMFSRVNARLNEIDNVLYSIVRKSFKEVK